MPADTDLRQLVQQSLDDPVVKILADRIVELEAAAIALWPRGHGATCQTNHAYLNPGHESRCDCGKDAADEILRRLDLYDRAVVAALRDPDPTIEVSREKLGLPAIKP